MASTNIPIRFTDQQQTSLDERTALSGKDSRSDFIRDFALIGTDEDFKHLCAAAESALMPVDAYIWQLILIGYATANNQSVQADLGEIRADALVALQRSHTDMLAQVLYLLTSKSSDQDVEEAEQFADEVVAKKFETLDAVADEKARLTQKFAGEGAGNEPA